MKFYFDENFSPYLIKGLKYIQSGRNAENAEILSIKDEFNAGCKDEEWIPVVASKNGVVITQDININRTKYLHALFTKHKLCVFYFRTPNPNFAP